MANGEVQNAPATEEAADQLGDSQDKRQDDWSPDDLNAEQRAQYDRGVGAVDEFLKDKRTRQYEPTDANREKLLAYLDEHGLPMSFGGLYVAFEQLSEAGELELSSDGQRTDEEQPDASARLATAGLARGTRSLESEEDAEESEPEPEEPTTARGKPTAWWNGKEVEVEA